MYHSFLTFVSDCLVSTEEKERIQKNLIRMLSVSGFNLWKNNLVCWVGPNVFSYDGAKEISLFFAWRIFDSYMCMKLSILRSTRSKFYFLSHPIFFFDSRSANVRAVSTKPGTYCKDILIRWLIPHSMDVISGLCTFGQAETLLPDKLYCKNPRGLWF